MARTRGAALLGGTFSDRGRAQAAFDRLMDERSRGSAAINLAFYGSDGAYLLVAAAEGSEAEDQVTRVLSEHGAAVQKRRLVDWLADARSDAAHAVRGPGQRPAHARAALARWAQAALLFMEQGLLAPDDLLVLLVASGKHSDTLPADERRRRLQEADDELRDVSEQLESDLRARCPQLFDRRGRLRPAELARRLAERTGGKQALSGAELYILEAEADVAAERSMRAT